MILQGIIIGVLEIIGIIPCGSGRTVQVVAAVSNGLNLSEKNLIKTNQNIVILQCGAP